MARTGPKERFTVEQVANALRQCKGMKGPAAQMLGLTWSGVDGYCKRHPTLQKVLNDEREMTTDVAELSLFRAVQNGDAWAVQFYLRTQGKKRGYNERNELTGPNGGPIQTQPVLDEKTTAMLEQFAEFRRSAVTVEPAKELPSGNGHRQT